MMNVTDKNMDVQSVVSYYAKMKENNQKYFLEQLDKMKLQRLKLEKMIPTSKTKKKAVSGVLVTGATKRSDIKSYIVTLRQKIDEIMMGEGDKNEKMAKANLLQMKINDLEKIIAKQIRQETERQTKKRKKIKDRVYLTKEDLTLNGDGDESSSNSESSGMDSIGGNVDLTSDANDVSLDGDLESDSELDLEA